MFKLKDFMLGGLFVLSMLTPVLSFASADSYDNLINDVDINYNSGQSGFGVAVVGDGENSLFGSITEILQNYTGSLTSYVPYIIGFGIAFFAVLAFRSIIKSWSIRIFSGNGSGITYYTDANKYRKDFNEFYSKNYDEKDYDAYIDKELERKRTHRYKRIK